MQTRRRGQQKRPLKSKLALQPHRFFAIFSGDEFLRRYLSSKEENDNRHLVFTSFIKREIRIRTFHIVVVQRQQRNVQKVYCTYKGKILLA